MKDFRQYPKNCDLLLLVRNDSKKVPNQEKIFGCGMSSHRWSQALQQSFTFIKQGTGGRKTSIEGRHCDLENGKCILESKISPFNTHSETQVLEYTTCGVCVA